MCGGGEKREAGWFYSSLCSPTSSTRVVPVTQTFGGAFNLKSKGCLKLVYSVVKLHFNRQKHCLFRCLHPERRERQQSGGGAPDRNIWWRPWTVFMESSCESTAASFLPLMNEISHAALLRAAALPGGSALSPGLPLMPSNALLALVNSWRTILGTNTPLIETFN